MNYRGLAGKKIVVTRPETRGGRLAAAIVRAGAEAVHLPLLEIERLPFTAPAADAIERYDRIVFTSANAVSCFLEGLDSAGRATFMAHRGIATVGPATAGAVAAGGATVGIVAREHVAECLAVALGCIRGSTVLWPRAESVRKTFARLLFAGGASLTELPVYRTRSLVPVDAADKVRDADAVAFTSPSGVRAWRSLGLPQLRVVCIGPVTASAAAGMGMAVDAVASPYTIDGIVAALRRALASGNQPA